MRAHLSHVAVALAFSGAAFLASSSARANGFETPSNGTEQLGRGAAWMARAADPLATFYNPAALSRNGTAVSANANFFFQKACFQRESPDGDPTHLTVAGSQSYGQVCEAGKMFLNPQLAFQWRLSDKLGLGIAVMGPSAVGKMSWPETGTNTVVTGPPTLRGPKVGPSGTRYILTNLDAKIIWPQIGVGYEVADNFRVGASLIWGMAFLNFGNYSMQSPGNQTANSAGPGFTEDPSGDLIANVKAQSLFVPGFVLSTMYTVADSIDIAAWYHYSAPVNAKGTVDVESFAFDKKGNQIPDSGRATNSTPADSVTVKVPQPMEAKLGARWYMKRDGVALTEKGGLLKDPLRDEVLDVELDLEWDHDSQFDNLELRLPALLVTPPGVDAAVPAPQNADTPHMWKDSYGVRLGGDYAVLPDQLAVRAGAWFQTSSFRPEYVHIDFLPAQRLALTAGATYRVSIVDIQVGYAHVFFKDVDNHGDGQILALAGGAPPNRSTFGVNGGKLTASSNIASVGAVVRF